MGIVIPFEVVRQDKPDTEAELRIAEKEAIYRGLIEQEAVMDGVPFEDMLATVQEAREEVLASTKTSGWHQDAAKRKGVSLYEHELGERIAFLGFLQKAYRARPDLQFKWKASGCDL